MPGVWYAEMGTSVLHRLETHNEWIARGGMLRGRGHGGLDAARLRDEALRPRAAGERRKQEAAGPIGERLEAEAVEPDTRAGKRQVARAEHDAVEALERRHIDDHRLPDAGDSLRRTQLLEGYDEHE